MDERPVTFWSNWHERIRALRNIGPLLKIVWNSGPGVVSAGAICRLLGAAIPISMLAVAKRSLDSVQAHFAGQPLPPTFWWCVGAEFALAVFGSTLGRTIGYFDALLADRFARDVS